MLKKDFGEIDVSKNWTAKIKDHIPKILAGVFAWFTY